MIARFPTLRLEGGLISSDQIDRVADQKVEEFSIDDIAAAWSDIRSYWTLFEKSLAKLPEDNLATSETRNRWMIPFFSTLGYELSSPKTAAEVDGQTYAISHRAGKDDDSPPIHIVGFRQSLDRRPESGRPRLAPHSLVQEYLNRTEHLWGIVTNGSTLRILRDSHLLRKQAYIEFDLEQIMRDELFADFALLYRIIHVSRLPRGMEDASDCVLEQYHRQTVEQGGRVREHLRDGVEKAITRFANGFLTHPRNTVLRGKVQDKSIEPFEFYQQILRLIYRFLFLAVSEERNLITDNMPYREYYSISRIRRLAEVRAAYTDLEDLWLGLATSFKLFQDESLGPLLSVPILNGDLFDPGRTSEINDASLTNRDLLTAMWDICMYREKESTPWRRINYASLDVEELGSVYESLLDFQPVFISQDDRPEFTLLAGTDRKTTGSYYTHPELVNELIQSALVPVIMARLASAKTPEEKEAVLLALSVCDPACGSGHFLLAAARTIGRELAKVRTGDEEPAPEQLRIAIRDAITHCIYGVDKNPLAIDLCKVALWLEGHTKGKPLTFLDHRIRCGDSLVGVFDLAVLKEGIPDDAYTAVTGDDKAVARELKKQNKKERENRSLTSFDIAMNDITSSRQQVNAIADDRPEDIRKKKEIFSAYQQEGTPWCKDNTACDLWTAAFFVGLTKEQVQSRHVPTTETVREYIAHGAGVDLPQVKIARQLANKYRFFHWALEFSEVFAKGGFDCVLGNPPWEKIKLQEREFFASRDPEIANAQTAAIRQKHITSLQKGGDAAKRELYDLYLRHLHNLESQNKFITKSDRYPLSGKGDVNTYASFSELALNFINRDGMVGVIVKTGIVSDDNTKDFFDYIVKNRQIVNIIDFSNKNLIFPAVIPNERFCILTAVAREKGPEKFGLSILNDKVDPKSIKLREYYLSAEDILKINPNTKTCPLFNYPQDAIICKKIYKDNPVLINEASFPINNSWNIEYYTMFHMTNDSKLFYDKEALLNNNFILKNGIFKKEDKIFLPLYEGKLFNLYDHRWGTFEGIPRTKRFGVKAEPNHPNDFNKADPKYEVEPRYWVNKDEVIHEFNRKSIIPDFNFIFRDICRTYTDSRTARGTIVPYCGVGNTAAMIIFRESEKKERYSKMMLFNCVFNSMIFDYIVRQKISSAHLNKYTLIQIAFPEPETFKKIIQRNGVSRSAKEWIHEEIKLLFGYTESLLPLVTPFGVKEPIIWNKELRFEKICFLDAIIAEIYGLSRSDLEYILTTFRVLERAEVSNYGEYRSKRLILQIWDEIHLPSMSN